MHRRRRNTDAGDRQPWTLLVLLSVAQFMVILDVTVVNVALPSIGTALGFATADLQWVVSAYVLFSGGLLLLGGRAADLLGRRRMFLSGVALFTGASLASGLAPSAEALVAARAAQGAGAALLSPAALSIISTAYHGAQRASALAVWGAIGAGGAAAGVLLGGMLTTWLSWEWVFFVNIPVGAVTALGAVRLVPSDRPAARAGRALDGPGALSVVAGLAALVYAIEGTATHGWGSARTLALLGASAALLAGFAAIERSVARPLVPPAVWRVRSLVSSATIMLGATGILVGVFFLNSLQLQRAMGASALETGLAFLPLALVIGAAAHGASRLLPRAGARAVVVGGIALLGAGSLLLAGAPEQASYVTDLLPGFLAVGAGAGLAFVALQVTAMADVGHETAGLASGMMMTAHEIGAALGVAVLSVVAAGGGYGDGFIASAAIAGALVLVALTAVPSVRPAAAARAMMH